MQAVFCSGGVKKINRGRQECFLFLILTAHGTEGEACEVHGM